MWNQANKNGDEKRPSWAVLAAGMSMIPVCAEVVGAVAVRHKNCTAASVPQSRVCSVNPEAASSAPAPVGSGRHHLSAPLFCPAPADSAGSAGTLPIHSQCHRDLLLCSLISSACRVLQTAAAPAANPASYRISIGEVERYMSRTEQPRPSEAESRTRLDMPSPRSAMFSSHAPFSWQPSSCATF